MAELKTKPTDVSVDDFLDAVADSGRRDDARIMCALMQRLTGEPPKMWGPSIIGFGSYTYRYGSGHGGTWPRIGFSPRAKELVLYLIGGFPRHQSLLDKLGMVRTGKSCLYIKRLADVDQDVLEQMLRAEIEYMDATYPR